MGWTFDAIAAAYLPCERLEHREAGGLASCPECLPMYTNRSAAKKAVDRALADEYGQGASTREQYRRQQLAQLDLLLSSKMPEALGRSDSANEAARVVLRALDRRARLLGLDAPTRVQVTTELDMQIEELVTRLADLDDEPARKVAQLGG